jgi:RPA family protein
MEGDVRVFAGEFCRSTYCVPVDGEPGSYTVITCGGARCTRVFITGVLTELSDSRGMLHCRLADPTGTFDLGIRTDGRDPLADTVRKIPIPSFLAVTGTAQMRKYNPGTIPFIRPSSVRVIDRSARDAWILRTADSTLHRIRRLASVLNSQQEDSELRKVIDHYHLSPASLLDLTAMVESALSGIKPAAAVAIEPQQDPRTIIMKIIRDLQGARGVPVDEVVAQAGLFGIESGQARKTVNELIEEDECYQPQKGSVRLL